MYWKHCYTTCYFPHHLNLSNKHIVEIAVKCYPYIAAIGDVGKEPTIITITRTWLSEWCVLSVSRREKTKRACLHKKRIVQGSKDNTLCSTHTAASNRCNITTSKH